MKIADATPGLRVVTTDGDHGTVQSIDRDGDIVYVAIPIKGGMVDVMDIDPGDLEPTA